MLIFLSSSKRSKFFSITFFCFSSLSSSLCGSFKSSKAFLKFTLAATLIIVRIYPKAIKEAITKVQINEIVFYPLLL